MHPTIISLPLGSCLSMRTESSLKLLDEISYECNVAATASARHWLRAQEHQAAELLASKKKFSEWCPNTLMKEMRQVASQSTRHINAKTASSVVQSVVSHLKTRLPRGTSRRYWYRWQAILGYELSTPAFRQKSIPVQSQDFRLALHGQIAESTGKLSDRIDSEIRRISENQLVYFQPLIRRDSDRHMKSLIWRMPYADLAAGYRRMVDQIVSGEIRPRDSVLTYHERSRKWILRLVVMLEEQLCDGNESATLVFSDDADDVNPILVKLDSDMRRKRSFGFGRMIIRQQTQLVSRRKALQARYRIGATSGHGRKQLMAAIRPITRRRNDLLKHVVKTTSSDIVKWLLREEVNRLKVIVPSVPRRRWFWWARHGIDWNWDMFVSQLEHACKKKGVVCEIEVAHKRAS